MTRFEVRRGAGESAPLADAHEIRREVFIDEQGVSEAEEMDGRDDEATHVVAYDDGRPVGTGRLREVADGVGKVERVAVRADARNRGLGRVVMEALHDVALEADIDHLVCHAQVRVADFYRELGYEAVGEEFQEANIPHVEMEQDL